MSEEKLGKKEKSHKLLIKRSSSNVTLQRDQLQRRLLYRGYYSNPFLLFCFHGIVDGISLSDCNNNK